MRRWRGLARGAGLALALVAAGAGARAADDLLRITAAAYAEPDRSYRHLVLGKDHNWGALDITLSSGETFRLRPGGGLVFEDTAPRLVDITGDAAPEILSVESAAGKGARIAIFGLSDGRPARIAATAHFGRSNRWYAPVGAADLDGDGRVEVVFVDRPHLARTLRVFRYEDGRLRPVASLAGVTNHRIGAPDIAGGIRDCGAGPEMVVADARWRRLLAVRLRDGALEARDIGAHDGRESFRSALVCR